MSDLDLIRAQAEGVIRYRMRQAVVESATVDRISAHQIAEIEQAICAALTDPRIAWALAYLAGVVMAPELLKQTARDTVRERQGPTADPLAAASFPGAQTRPAQPLGERGAVEPRKVG